MGCVISSYYLYSMNENLILIKRIGYKKSRMVSLYKCYCGNEFEATENSIKTGNKKSCGCKKTAAIIKRNTTHGLTFKNKRLYRCWSEMKKRCNNPNVKNYHSYGGRGITVCPEWQNSYETFYKWAVSHGYADNLTIERNNFNGNYCPGNCCFITRRMQQFNRSNVLGIVIVREIRNKFANGEKLISLSKFYSVTTHAIREIVNRVTYAEIE